MSETINAKLDDFVKANELNDAISINPTDLDSELLRMAPLYARFGVLLAKARSQRDFAKSDVELVEAKLDKLLRDKFTEKGEKVTENKIRSEIIMQPSYIAAVQRLNEATSILSVTETAANSLEMKRDMLVQLNKNAEREWAYTNTLAGKKEALDSAIKGMRPAS